MILSQISAMSENRVIGVKNSLPWNLPEDLKFFKDKTKGKIMLMGQKTFESLPGVLPGRFHIVISRELKNHQNPLVKYVGSIPEAFTLAESMIPQWPEEVFVVGGGEIYRQTLPYMDFVYLTIIHQHYEGDTYFPELNDNFKLIDQQHRTEPVSFAFCKYQNLKKATLK